MGGFKISFMIDDDQLGPIMKNIVNNVTHLDITHIEDVPFTKNKRGGKRTKNKLDDEKTKSPVKKPTKSMKRGKGKLVMLKALQKAGEKGVEMDQLEKLYNKVGLVRSSLMTQRARLLKKGTIKQIGENVFLAT